MIKAGIFFTENLKSLRKPCGLEKGSVVKDLDSSKQFVDYLSYKEFNSDLDIFENKSTYSFALKLTPFSGIGIEEVNALKKIVSYEIPSNAVVQVVNYASPQIKPLVDKWCNAISDNVSGIYENLSEKRRKFFLRGAKSELWLKGSGVVLRNFEVYFSVSFAREASVRGNGILLNKIVEIRSKIERAFQNIGCVPERVTKEILNNYLEEILFTCKAKDATGTSPNNRALALSQNPQYTMYENFAEVQYRGMSKKLLVFEVAEYPRDWEMFDCIDYVGKFETGKGLSFPFFISFGFKAQDAVKSDKQATKTRMIRINQTTGKLANFFPKMVEELEDWQLVSDEIDKGARLSQSCMHVVALIDDEVDSKHAIQDVIDHFYTLGFKVEHIKYDCSNSLFATLLMHKGENWTQLKKNKELSTGVTSSCVNLLPIFADAQNANNPLMMFVGRRGQVFFFDNYVASANGNYNMVVVGKSGSGKSVFIQEYMISILRQGGQVVVLDDGNSFESSAKILGGDFVDFRGEAICINPFSLLACGQITKDYRTDFEEPLIDLILSILCVIANIDKNNTKDFAVGFQRTVLKDAVQVVLQDKKDKGGFADVCHVLKNDSRVRTVRSRDIADDLAHVLKPYGEGRYAHHFNGKASLSVDKLLTVFEFSSLQSDQVLQTSVLVMVVFLVYTKMQARQRRTSLIIDEAWRLLSHDAIKGFIEGIARRARKYNGSLVTATQNISDFEESKSASAAAVLSQSDWRVILKAESKDEKTLKEQLGMSTGEVGITQGLKGEKGYYSEFMIRHSSGAWSIGRLILDSFSVKLYSSTAGDVTKVRQLREQGYSLAQAIEQLID